MEFVCIEGVAMSHQFMLRGLGLQDFSDSLVFWILTYHFVNCFVLQVFSRNKYLYCLPFAYFSHSNRANSIIATFFPTDDIQQCKGLDKEFWCALKA